MRSGAGPYLAAGPAITPGQDEVRPWQRNHAKGGGELFYLDEHGNQQDAALHEEILGERINKERLLPPG